jgi:hypothetical protein
MRTVPIHNCHGSFTLLCQLFCQLNRRIPVRTAFSPSVLNCLFKTSMALMSPVGQLTSQAPRTPLIAIPEHLLVQKAAVESGFVLQGPYRFLIDAATTDVTG